MKKSTLFNPLAGVIKASLLMTCMLFLAILSYGQATLTTDKADYPPGSWVTITGSGFGAVEAVSVQVTHNPTCCDDATAPDHQPWSVTADQNGGFVTQWWCPADLDELGAHLIANATGQSSSASATFTDGDVNLDQFANGAGSNTPQWQNGDLNHNNSQYAEANSVPFRYHISNVVAGQTYSFTIQSEWTKGGKHAYDYFTAFDRSEAAKITSIGGACSNTATTFPALCGGTLTTAAFPDPTVSANWDATDPFGGSPPYYLTPSNVGFGVSGTPIELQGYNVNSVSFSNYSFTGTTNDRELNLRVIFTATADGDAAFFWGGHLARGVDAEWGIGNGAGSISGAPFHMRGIDFEEGAIGDGSGTNQDRSIQPGQETIIVCPTNFASISASSTDLCFGPVTLTASGGVSYLWGPNGETTNPIVVSAAGTYTVTASDELHCAADTSVTINNCNNLPPSLDCSALGQDYGCVTSVPSIPAATADDPLVDGGCFPVNVTWGTDHESVNGCLHTITRTYTATDACQQTDECTATWTYSIASAPVFSGLPTGSPIDLGCNNGTPSCANVTASNECGDADVTCTSPLGAVSTGGCGWTQTFHYHAAASCGGTADADVTYTWSTATAPVFHGLPTGSPINLGCNNGTPSCANVTASNECGDATVTCTSPLGAVSTGGCGWTQTFHYHAAASCGGTADADVTYTWSTATAPVFSELPSSGALSCNASPSCDTHVTASNECGAATVTCSSPLGVVSTGGCGRSQTFHYHASSSCGGVNDADVTYTWNAASAPTFNNLPSGGARGCNNPPSCVTGVTASNACGTYTATCTPGGITSTGCSRSQKFTYSATATCGGTTSQDVNYTWTVSNSVSLTAPGTLPVCGLGGNSLTATASGTGTVSATTGYAWTVTGTGWSITSGNGTPTIIYKAGNSGTSGTFTVVITNSCGCTATNSVTFGSSCTEGCAYTQGYYHGTGSNCQGISASGATGVVASALSQGNLVIGTTGHSITFLTTDAACLQGKLPAGTTPSQLYAGNIANCASIPNNSNYINSGKLKSALAGQVIALSLSLRNTSNLGSILVTGKYVTTYKASSCTNGVAVANTKLVKGPIPASIFTALGSSFTIAALRTAANNALGNGSTTPSLSDWTSACDIINNAFDGCRILAGFGSGSSGVRVIADGGEAEAGNYSTSISANAFPNPFNSITTIEFSINSNTANTVVEVYTLAGSKVATIFNGTTEPGMTYSAQFNAEKQPGGVYLYRIVSGGEVVNGKIVLMK